MRNLSAVLIIAALFSWTGLSSIDRHSQLALPRTGDGGHVAGPGSPIVPLGDDAGGSH